MTQPQQPLAPHARAQKLIDEVRGVRAEYGIDSASWKFLNDLVERGQRFLSEKQRKWLEDLEHRVFVKGPVE